MKKRYTFELRITLPEEAFTEEYVSALAAAIERVRPDLKGQRAMVCYLRDDPAGGKK